ncbi:hypothetical protein PENTCL1PPCAC_21247, partial [Pristionchus entomophagus]
VENPISSMIRPISAKDYILILLRNQRDINTRVAALVCMYTEIEMFFKVEHINTPFHPIELTPLIVNPRRCKLGDFSESRTKCHSGGLKIEILDLC